MSKLWSSFLEIATIAGNHSGCHQMPERSFFINGRQMPVCARCTGVFIGQCMAIIFKAARPKDRGVWIPALLLMLMGIDWGIQEFGIKESTNRRRLITGIAGGFGLFRLYFFAFSKMWEWVTK